MRMTRIYQPIMLKTILESDKNEATVEEIARRFLNEDSPQLEYYKKITKRWPHDTLVKKRKILEYDHGTYRLKTSGLTAKQKERLKELCDLRHNEFLDKDPRIKRFKELDKRSKSGSLRYDVLAKSKGVCVACGAYSTVTPLHVDHIIPYSLGGKTELENLQALCEKCNTQKRDRDDTDFLWWHKKLEFRKNGCGQCSPRLEGENELAFWSYFEKSTTKSHAVVAPTRHVGYNEMIPAEKTMCLDLIDEVKSEVCDDDSEVSGFDIKFNTSVDHCRIHVVPLKG